MHNAGAPFSGSAAKHRLGDSPILASASGWLREASRSCNVLVVQHLGGSRSGTSFALRVARKRVSPMRTRRLSLLCLVILLTACAPAAPSASPTSPPSQAAQA